MAKKKDKKIRVTLRKSRYGRKPRQVKTLEAMGLRKIGKSVELPANPAVLGMVEKVAHLVEVEELS
mgnify:CR=1 FL=1